MSEESFDYGPLAGLIGTWTGDKGMDIAPDPEGKEENPYYETIVFEGIGYATNAEKQQLAAIRYLQVVRRKADDQVFHDQTGYWMWDAERDIVMQSLAIPRAVCLLAGGTAATDSDGKVCLNVESKEGDDAWDVVQSPFMHAEAKTLSFKHAITLSGNELHYAETTMVDIYGNVFEHTDTNTLVRQSQLHEAGCGD